MADRYNPIKSPSKKELESLYGDGLSQKQVGEKYGVSQKVVFRWFKELGIRSRVPKNNKQTGKDNPSWKGDEASYAALHYRVQSVRGTPTICSMCESVKAKRFEWANVTGNYSDIYDYIRLCKSCHSKFDGVIKNITEKLL